MLKKLTLLLIILLSLFSVNISAEEESCVFTTTHPFPMVYSDSIKVVNARHNIYTADNLEDISYLIDAGIVKSIEPMSYSELFDYTLNDKYYSNQANMPQVSAPFAWSRGHFGENVKIAVIDSGVYLSSVEFNNLHLVEDYTSTKDTTNHCGDELGHGTMVTGIIAAAHNAYGVAGIAPQSEIYVFKCFYKAANGNTAGRNVDIADAVYKAVDEYDCDIINISAGSKNPPLVMKDAVEYALQNGVTIVSAAGNYGNLSSAAESTALYYPASYDGVISVGSVDVDGSRANHSQKNDRVNLLAPGIDIFSSGIGTYTTGHGTSFAAPHVTAAAALVKSLYPDMMPEDIRAALFATCDKITDKYSGYGILNIQSLLTFAKARSLPDTLVTSEGDSKKCAYFSPSGEYKMYFARYTQNMLTDIKEGGISVSPSVFSNYTHYIWDKNTLAPYDGVINELTY